MDLMVNQVSQAKMVENSMEKLWENFKKIKLNYNWIFVEVMGETAKMEGMETMENN